MMFTSGTTSVPKAVPLTHGNLVASIYGIVDVCDLSSADSTLIVMPLFHGHGLVAGPLATLASGERLPSKHRNLLCSSILARDGPSRCDLVYCRADDVPHPRQSSSARISQPASITAPLHSQLQCRSR